ncbi:MAG: oligoendopeptidase F [Clostridium sp.]|nr:oligoendopeptidase F [Clostridium sp.]MCM1444636.1 oligoendopeptidase F [Candidatus Amulumruptor caecigallinarius]
MNQLLRSEISDEYKWDLGSIYSSNELFEADLGKCLNLIDKIKDLNDIVSSADKLLECLELQYSTNRILEKLYTYAHHNLDADTTNTFYQELLGKVKNLDKEFCEATSFIKPTLLKCDYSLIEKFYGENEGLKEYEVVLKDLFRYKAHTLSENEEMVVSKLSKALSSSSNTYECLTDSDMTFGLIKDEDNDPIELTTSNYSRYIKSSDRRVRKEAFDTTYETYAKYKNTLASTYVGDIETNSSVAKIYNFNSAIEASLFEDDINISVYDNLIHTVSNNLKPLYRYYDIKKKALNLEQMHLYDTYVSIISDNSKEYSFEEAKKIVIDALSILGDDYINNLKRAFSEKWIDVYNNKGKRSGAYSGGAYDTNPFVLLNYENTLNDVSTLAHELGHSMHSYYSRKNNSYQNSGYKIFVAEVASTVNELLLAFYQLDNTDDRKEKLVILNNLLDLFKSTIYRQTMFAEFERDMYRKHENNEVLTYEVLNNSYYELNKKYFGENVVVDDYIKYEWERIPHFYYNFYVYKYATGLSAACYIVNNILENKNNMKEKYLKFLTLGGSMSPLEELKVMGIDMTDSKVIESAINMFDGILERFEKLLLEK